MWQLVLEEFLLAVLDNPDLLLRYDMVGNRLDERVDAASAVCFDEGTWLHSSRRPRNSVPSFAEEAVAYLKANEEDPGRQKRFRGAITRVGAGDGWQKAAATRLKEPAPFDEPTLGIIGMW